MHGGAYMRGAYTWSKTGVKEKEGGEGGGEYSMQSSPTLINRIFKFSG